MPFQSKSKTSKQCYQKIKISICIMLQQWSQAFQTIYLSVRLSVDKRCLWGIPWLYRKTWPFNICYPISFSKNSWIVIGFGLDCQSIYKIRFGFGLPITYLWWIIGYGLDWQSKIIGLSNSLSVTYHLLANFWHKKTF